LAKTENGVKPFDCKNGVWGFAPTSGNAEFSEREKSAFYAKWYHFAMLAMTARGISRLE